MSRLFITIEDLKEAVAVNSDLPIEDLTPYLRAAQRFVARFTGEALMERITDKLEDGEPLSDLEKALRDRLRVPVANLALIRYANVRNVSVSDIGIHRTQTGNSSDAFEWQINRLSAQLEADAWEGLEELHRFLEAKRDDFSEYTDSDAFKADSKALIRSAAQFNRYLFINDSRLTFYALQSAMRQAQQKRIKPALGVDFDAILTALSDDSLTTVQEDKLDMARTALVHATLARALRERVVEVGNTGVQVCSVMVFATQKEPAAQKAIDAAVAYHEEQAVDALNSLSKLVNPTPSTTSSAYTGGLLGGRGLISF